jgi:hypothetical protein
MEGIRIHIRRLKHYVLVRAITDADRIRNNKMQQDKTSIPMSDVVFVHELYALSDERFRTTLF